LGIAQRQIRIKYAQKLRKQKKSKPLPTTRKTLGDWLRVKRLEKNLMPGHVAAKMGVAAALVKSWENDTDKPDKQQWKFLAKILEFAEVTKV
jgi:ribosome-binding protein aMBF1 (putative translation factor)